MTTPENNAIASAAWTEGSGSSMPIGEVHFWDSPERFLAHCRNVSRDDLPAMFGESHPGLALAADKIVAPHLELKVDRREIAPERQDLEADAALLDTGTRRTGHPVLVNGFEAVAVLVECIADSVWAVPEGRIEHRDVLKLE